MTSSCPKRRRAKRTCALMADRTPCLRREGMINATSPNQEGVEGTDSRSGLDDHRRISDTGHIYLLVGNNFVLPHQGGIFLRSFATRYISLRNSWEGGKAISTLSEVFLQNHASRPRTERMHFTIARLS